ncbi:vomeronasal type-2 receptor 26-like [Dendropsophus ebraccatus]|uniref:vomeronasal type-2 receptor 26-like n=1 Tax=Dendropsophus ebraccatus TaxID=150705 RepID=UPI003831D84A
MVCNLSGTGGCSKKTLWNHHLLEDKSEIYHMTFTLYAAVYAVAHALNKMDLAPKVLTSKEWLPRAKYETPSSTCSKACSTGHRKSFHRGKQKCCFMCLLCPEGEFTNLTDRDECMKCPLDHYSSYTRDRCVKRQPDFLSFADSLGVLLTSFAVTMCAISAVVLWIFVRYRNTPIAKTNNRNLTYILLSCLMLSFLSCLLFIGHPTELICRLREAFFLVTYATAISSVLGKALTVIAAFNSIKPGNTMRICISPMFSLSLVIVFSLGEFIICITWLIVAPPFLDFDVTAIKDKMILQCNQGSIAAFYTTIAYIGLLALSSFIVAFKVRKLPDRFNEAQCITFSMLVFCSVWIAFIPAYLSVKGKYLVVVQLFAMLASTGGLLVCIFFPKCYIVLVRPDLNIKETIHDKRRQT